jgi:hypothetical protein
MRCGELDDVESVQMISWPDELENPTISADSVPLLTLPVWSLTTTPLVVTLPAYHCSAVISTIAPAI